MQKCDCGYARCDGVAPPRRLNPIISGHHWLCGCRVCVIALHNEIRRLSAHG